MLLRDLPMPIDDAQARGLALVFGTPLAVRLAELHAAYGSTNCVPVPRVLSDGRLMLGADVLTEIRPGGLLAGMWSHADTAVVGASVEVVSWSEAVQMLPPDPIAFGGS